VGARRFLSESEIEAEFGVSRTVIRLALRLVESGGHLVRRKGRGNFVVPSKVSVRVTGLGRLLSGADVPGITAHILEARSFVPERAVAESCGSNQLAPRSRISRHAYV
jgi:DNA-binding GntR family transcriptional regulator